MLIDVFNRVCADAGYQPVQQRAAVIKLLQAAAKEIYDRLECDAIFRETTLVVPANKIIAIPSFVGQLKAMREHTTDWPFDLASISTPRYVHKTWEYRWMNWRNLPDSALHTYPESIGPFTIAASVIEDTPANIVILGRTNVASKIEETVVLSSSPKATVNQFTQDIFNIACLTPRTVDITISDVNGNQIAVLYNNQNRTRYKLADVSELFWSKDTTNNETLIDVLYKMPLEVLSKDTDTFPAGDDYDNAWYFMAMHLFYKPLENRQQDAAANLSQAIATLVSIKSGVEKDVVKKVTFGQNKFFNLFRGHKPLHGYYPYDNPR